LKAQLVCGSGRTAAAAIACAVLLLLVPAPLLAHGDTPAGPWDVWNHWSFAPTVLAGLALTAAVYSVGLRRLWLRAGAGRVVSRARATAFGLALLFLFVALVSPLDPLAEVLFSAHMLQHLLLVLVAAPLLVTGAPEVAGLWAFAPSARARIGRAWRRIALAARAGGDGGVRLTLLSVAIAAVTLWAWHVPSLYDLAVRDDAVHAAEHVTFLVTAVFLWASVLRLRPRDQLDNGVRVVCVFFTAVQGSILGALITFADRPLYLSHASIAAAWGITPLADQQLAGLLMWVPPALLYIGVAAWLFVRWLDAIGRSTRLREARGSARRVAGAAP
jgi:putative membrane protein